MDGVESSDFCNIGGRESQKAFLEGEVGGESCFKIVSGSSRTPSNWKLLAISRSWTMKWENLETRK